jgi:predicted RNA binding protein YcfA (HicA-like mRNA interferase family)
MATATELLRFLQQQGYHKVRQTGSHWILEHAERPMLVVPFHRGDLPKGLFLRILRDAGFTLEEFRH